VKVLDENNKEMNEPGNIGKIAIKLPCPPSFMLTLWNND
jgi:acyl-coenzyme A synthetase/AMP-(fatty) acid ligase